MKHLLWWLYEKYQYFQGFILLALILFFTTLIILGTMFIYHFKTIMRCIGLACLMLMLAPLPACKLLQDKPDNFLLDMAKAITKTNLQRVFPDAHFERDSISATKVVSREFLAQVFHEKVRLFLTPTGELQAQTQDFYARISWEKVAPNAPDKAPDKAPDPKGEFIKIRLVYYKKVNLQSSRTLPAKRARDGLICSRVSCMSC